MADSIEQFVQKLQREGVQAGRTEAHKLVEDARAEAERLVSEAKHEADAIVAQAEQQAQRVVKQGADELQLGARDVLLSLREVITRALEAVLKRRVGETLSDQEFLRKLLHEVVVQYAQKDAQGIYPIEIRVGDDVLQAASEWAVSEMTRDGQDAKSRFSLHGGLQSAGFEYSAAGGTVEVTPESTSNVLRQMISPRLRELIDKAAAGQK